MCVQVASLYLWCRSFPMTQVPQCPASPRTLPSLAKTSPLTSGAGGKSSAFTTIVTRTPNHWNSACGALCPSSFSLSPFRFFHHHPTTPHLLFQPPSPGRGGMLVELEIQITFAKVLSFQNSLLSLGQVRI